jgi:hypothetical protein
MTTTVNKHIETIRPEAGVPPQSGGVKPPPLPPAPSYKVVGDTVVIHSEFIIWYWSGNETAGKWMRLDSSFKNYFLLWQLGSIAFFGRDDCEPVGAPPAYYWQLLESGCVPFGTLPVEIETRAAA